MKYMKIFLVLVGFFVIFNLGSISSVGAWWNPSWDYYVNITINSSQVDSDLTDFVMLINGTDLNLTNAQTDGDDFVFVNSTDDVMPHEIELWDDATGQHIFWVKVPFINSSSDTIIKLYFGNAGASNQQNVSGTWSDYKAVFHMDDLTTSTINDSVGTYIGNKESANNPVEVSGQIGNAQHFNGTGNYINTTMYFGDIDDYSYMVWFKNDDTPADYEYILSQRATGQHWAWLRMYTTGHPFSSDERNDQYSHVEYETDMSGAGWTFAARTSARNDNAYLYIDDNTRVSTTVTDNQLQLDGGVTMHIGSQSSYATVPTNFFDGMIDEVRFASGDIWTENEIDATYSNTNSPSTFSTIGDMESASSDTYDIYSITLNSPPNNDDSTDQTQPINISVIGNASTYNCIVYFNDTNKGSNGAVANDTDTVITTSTLSYGYYDWYVNCTVAGDVEQSDIRNITISEILPEIQFVNPTNTDDETITNNYTTVNITVNTADLDTFIFNWNGTNYSIFDDNLVLGMNFNNYSALGDSTTVAKDMTSYANDGTLSVSEWLPEAKYGKSIFFDAIGNTQNDYMTVGNDASLNILSNITVEFWSRPQEFKNNVILGKYDGTASADDSYWFNIVDFDTLQFCLRDSAGTGTDCATYTLPSIMDIGAGFSETNTEALQGADTDGNLFYISGATNLDFSVERRYYGNKSILSTSDFLTTPVHCNSITVEGAEMILGCYDNSDNDPNTIRRYYKNNDTLIAEYDITAITNITSCEGAVLWGGYWWVYGAGKNVIAQFNTTWDFVDEHFIEKNLYYKISPPTGGFGKEGWSFWNETIDGVERTFAGGGGIMAGSFDFYEWNGTGFELIGLNMMSTSYNAEGSNSDYSNNSLMWLTSRDASKIYDVGLNMSLLPSDFWYHIVGTYDGTNVRLYVNNVAGTPSAKTDAIRSNPTQNLYIGSDNAGGNEYKGMIDNLMVYNRALSVADIDIHYESSFEKDNSTFYRFIINKTELSDGTYTYYGWMNTTSTSDNWTEEYTVYISTTSDTSPPAVSSYYQWDSTNTTVDFGVWTEGFVSVNWNLTDATGVNVSTCDIKVRNKNTATGYTNLSYIDDLNHPDYDIATGYKNLTCYSEDLGGGVTRVTANMTRSYDWRPLITGFEQDNAAQDNIFNSFGGRSTKITFHNISTTINTTFIFLADIVNQTNTVADMLFYACNETYVNGDFTTDDNCALVGAITPNATRDVNFDYVIGALETDENGSFGGVEFTTTMQGISYCPSCTNTGNAWITYSTDTYDGHSATSPNQGSTWTDLTGEEFNVILHVIDNTRLEFNLTIEDDLGNELSVLQTDDYGALANLRPFGDINTDNVTGELMSYYDIHNITENGTICINITVSDPNADTMNVSIYLLNNDSSMNQTLLLNQSIDGYGEICYSWDTTTVSDGDYRINVTAHDGSLIGYDESAGYVRIDNNVLVISITDPNNATTQEKDTNLYFTVSETVASVVYSIDGGANITACTDCSTYSQPNNFTVNEGQHYITLYALDYAGIYGSSTVYWTVELKGGSGGISILPSIPEIIEPIINITEEIIPEIKTWWENATEYMDMTIYEDKGICHAWEIVNQTARVTDGKIEYIGGEQVCTSWFEVKAKHPLYLIGVVVAYYLLSILYHIFETYMKKQKYSMLSARNQFYRGR